MIHRYPSAVVQELATRVLVRNYRSQLPKKLSKSYTRLIGRSNPHRDKDAMVDYKGELRTTPRGALVEINRLKRRNTLSQEQLDLLDALAVSIRDRFQMPGVYR